MPARAIGVKWLKVDPGQRKLTVATSAPEKSTPRSTLSIPVSVTGAAPGSDAYVMVAAVDVGILNLTKYEAPDPEAWFFGQRRLGIELRDLYGRLIDGSLGATGRIRTGGDGGAALSAQGSPPTEKLVAFFSGPVRLDMDGKATVNFDIPQFNGTVRIMTVAWTKEAVGHAEQDVIVRDPVVVTAALPRFMAPGDAAIMRLDVANTDGPDGDYSLAIETSGDVSTGSAALPDKLTLVGGKRVTMTVPLIAQTAGDAGITIRLAHAGRPRSRAGALAAGPPGRDAGHHPHGRRPRPERLQPARRPRTSRGKPARRRDRQRRRLPVGGLRRAVHADDARPLPLWLRRADDQPRAAAALCQRAGDQLWHEGRAGAEGAHPGRDLARAELPVLVRQLRPLGSGFRRPLARRLRLGLPDPRSREGLQRAGPGDEPGAVEPAELARLRHRPRGPRLGDRLRALRARPQQAGFGRRPQILFRHAARSLLEPDGGGAARARASRSMAMRSARRRPSRRPSNSPGTRRNTTGTAPTTARSFATARRSLRSPPKAGRCRRSCPSSSRSSRPIAPRRAGRARRTTPGCCLRRARCRPATPRSSSPSTVSPTPAPSRRR